MARPSRLSSRRGDASTGGTAVVVGGLSTFFPEFLYFSEATSAPGRRGSQPGAQPGSDDPATTVIRRPSQGVAMTALAVRPGRQTTTVVRSAGRTADAEPAAGVPS